MTTNIFSDLELSNDFVIKEDLLADLIFRVEISNEPWYTQNSTAKEDSQ